MSVSIADWFRRLRRDKNPLDLGTPGPQPNLAAAFALPDTPSSPAAGAAALMPPAEPGAEAADPVQEAAEMDLLRSAFEAAEVIVTPGGGLADEIENVDPAELMSEAYQVLALARSF